MSEQVQSRPRRGCMPCAIVSVVLLLVAVLLAGVVVLAMGVGLAAFRHPAKSLGFGPGVAILEVYGEIDDEQAILDDLHELLENPSTKAVVVRINSPGGAIAPVEEIYEALMKAREDGMPVVASMGATAASGGYLLSLAGQRIYASQGTLTGSIGVIIEYSSAKALFDKIGVKFETVSTGELKETGSIAEPLTDRQRAEIQDVVNDYHEQFIELVVRSRGMDDAKARPLADGRVFTGRQALSLGLIDEIGGLDDAVAYAGSLAGIQGKPREIRVREEPFSVFDIMRRLESDASSSLRGNAWAPKFVLR